MRYPAARHLTAVLLTLFLMGGGLGCAHRIQRVWTYLNLFDEDRLVENFRSMHRRFPARVVRRGGPVFEFPRRPAKLPRTFEYRGEDRDMEEFLARRVTTGLLVVKHDAITFEEYYLGNTDESLTISWSVGKSFVSALFGIAVGEGAIRSVQDPVTDYVPGLKGSGYDGVPLKDVLQMSSGIRFREDYGDWTSDINRMGRSLAFGKPLAEFVAGLRPDLPPGTVNRYVSMDTQVLGMVLMAATGSSLSSYLEEKLWGRLGVESDAWWCLDESGVEWAFGGLNVTLRDYARFGRLFLHGGRLDGYPLVPTAWVRDSLTPDAPHLLPGPNPASDSTFGYGYQWWIPEDPDGEFLAIGIYGQFIYVYPKERLVIVKTSADPHFQDNDYESDLETVAAFRAIARHLSSH